MDKVNNNPPLRLPPPPPQPPPPQTPTLPETASVPTFTLPLPLPPPPTITNALPSPSTHRRKRTKLVHVGGCSLAPPPPPPSTVTATSASSSVARPAYKCTECSKEFWSSKALYGHMRCHPERTWRGINPPPHVSRPLLLPPPPPTSPHFTDYEHEVAESLLLLSSSVQVDTTNNDCRTNVVKALMRFECSSCKKTFPTHQALGGHRASHKNVKGCFAITKGGGGGGGEEEGTSSAVVEGYNSNNFGGYLDMGLRLGLNVGLIHKCLICNKVFTSGQALGGHMRCHGEASTSDVVLGLGPVAQVVDTQSGFDLNQPAQVIDDDDGRPGGSDSSSSGGSVELDLRLRL